MSKKTTKPRKGSSKPKPPKPYEVLEEIPLNLEGRPGESGELVVNLGSQSETFSTANKSEEDIVREVASWLAESYAAQGYPISPQMLTLLTLHLRHKLKHWRIFGAKT